MPVTPNSLQQTAEILGCPPGRVPRSVAIIMDGNGRWARQRGLPRSVGHEVGATNVRSIATKAAELGLEALILYGFSTENWNRPATEIEVLMHLYAQHVRAERSTIVESNLRFRHIGRRQGLPEAVLSELDATTRASAENDGMFLCLALNYGGRAEITDVVRGIAEDVAAGRVQPSAIDESMVADRLSTAGVPDPDLLIRTSGEHRLSNFLLWQMSYAELYVADVRWPDFDAEQLVETLRVHVQRSRRYGSITRT